MSVIDVFAHIRNNTNMKAKVGRKKTKLFRKIGKDYNLHLFF